MGLHDTLADLIEEDLLLGRQRLRAFPVELLPQTLKLLDLLWRRFRWIVVDHRDEKTEEFVCVSHTNELLTILIRKVSIRPNKANTE